MLSRQQRRADKENRHDDDHDDRQIEFLTKPFGEDAARAHRFERGQVVGVDDVSNPAEP
jgi:hypothetical protein